MNCFRRTFILFSILTALILDAAYGQSRREEAHINADAQARTKVAGGDMAGAAKSIEDGLRQKANSAEWHMEKAFSLFRLGLSERKEGRQEQSVRLGNAALRELTKAEKKVDGLDLDTMTNIKEMASTILEHLSGDSNLAASLRAAADDEKKNGKRSRIGDLITIPDDNF